MGFTYWKFATGEVSPTEDALDFDAAAFLFLCKTAKYIDRKALRIISAIIIDPTTTAVRIHRYLGINPQRLFFVTTTPRPIPMASDLLFSSYGIGSYACDCPCPPTPAPMIVLLLASYDCTPAPICAPAPPFQL